MKQKHRNMKFTNFISRVPASNSIIFTFLMRISEFHLLDSFFLYVYMHLTTKIFPRLT